MLAIVYFLKKWKHSLQGATHKTIIYTDHQNLTYIKSAVVFNCCQARWAEGLKQFSFDLYYKKGSTNAKVDSLAMCPAFTSREGGTTLATNAALLRKEQWLEVGAMQIDNDEEFVSIQLAALEVEFQPPEAIERI